MSSAAHVAIAERRVGRVSMYGLWQVRDYLMDRGAPMHGRLERVARGRNK